MRNSAALFSLPAILALSLLGCTGTGNDNGDGNPPPIKTTCEAHSECGNGEICAGGTCRPGQCVPELQSECGPDAPEDVAPYCCKAWQFCNPLNECVADPDSPIGIQCEVSEDCPNVGQFCSGGTCYSPEGRDSCTASHQCPAGERCDRTVLLCVPDNGGCTYADIIPELACESHQVCDTETGFCIDLGEAECETDDECRAGQLCDNLGRCVQCLIDDDCGPGTQCNTGTGSCVSVGQSCANGETCPGNKVCNEATGVCEVPECTEDDDCDGRERCDLTNFKCYLPDPVCNESDEPNDALNQASEIPLSGYAGTLCRGNTDFLSFPVQANKRYRATVSFPDYNVEGVTLALFDTENVQLDTETIGFSNEAVVTGITAPNETGRFTLRLVGASTEEDQWSYTVTIEETEAPQQVNCDQELDLGIEPNDSFETAYTVPVDQPFTFARCGQNDVDYFRIQVEPLHGIEVSVEHDRVQGDLDAYLYTAPNNSSRVDSASTSNSVERVDSGEGPTEFWVKVERYINDTDADPNQAYVFTARQVPRPEACDADIHEPDGSVETAGDLPVDTSLQAIRCNPHDVDYFALTVPANRGGQLRIDFTHTQGDLRLDLLSADGETVIASSNRVPASGSELLDLPFAAADQHYIARVRLNAGSGSTGQQYTIQATTYDASACTLSEPTPNDTLNSGQCLGTFDTSVACVGDPLPAQIPFPGLATCANATEAIPGCGTVCGVGDEDWYRVGKLNDGQLLRARLEHDPDGGVLGLALVRMNANPEMAPNFVTRNLNRDGEPVIEVALVAPTLDPAFAREYAVLVQAEGSGTYTAQPYALEIEVGAPCLDDVFEPNDSRAASRLLRPGAQPGVSFDSGDMAASLCFDDLDVFELYAFAGETIRATLEGPDGVTVNLGVRPNDPDQTEPVTLPCGEGVPEGEAGPCAADDAGVPDAGNADAGDADAGDVDAGDVDAGPTEPTGRIVATVENEVSQPVFVTVKRLNSSAIGPYTLRIEVE